MYAGGPAVFAKRRLAYQPVTSMLDQVGNPAAANNRRSSCTQTRGILQDDATSEDFGPDSMPWILNSVFCPRTVSRGPMACPAATPCGPSSSARRRIGDGRAQHRRARPSFSLDQGVVLRR